MVSVDITVTGFHELYQGLNSSDFSSVIETALSECADEIENVTTGLCPVDTGDLQASISVSVSSEEIHVEATEDYASFVDEGTVYQDAQPFFTDPITSLVANELPQIIDQNISTHLSTL